MQASQPIGIFDSGVGGLTVATAIEKLLPNEQIIYVGDTQHMPYGDKSPEHIRLYCKRIVEFLIQKQVKLIVIACNTASSVAASYLRSIFWEQIEIIGVIRPAIQFIMQKQFHKIGIIGTQGTIQSHIYPDLFKEYQYPADIFQLATPLLAPMIEEGLHTHEVSQAIIHTYLQHPSFQDKEAILLACTHYPLIKHEVESYFHHQKTILDNALPMAQTTQAILSEKKLLSTAKIAEHQFYVTDFTENFERTAALFFGRKIDITAIDIHYES